jgi:thioredoxin reductase
MHLATRHDNMKEPREMYELVIIGGGPAGLSAAAFALSKDLNLRLVYEQIGGRTGSHQRLVGQATEERLAGEDLVHMLERDIAKADCTIHDRVVGITRSGDIFDVETRNHGTLQAAAVLLATGARPYPLDVPGATELAGWGVGYSVTTHAQLLAGKVAAVIGTTDRALRGVIELVHFAAQVYLIGDLSTSESSLAPAIAQFPKIKVLDDVVVREISGSFNAEELVLARGDKVLRLAVDAVFVDLGLTGNSEAVQGLAQTDLNGFVKVDGQRATSIPGLFAAGDVTTAVGEQKLIAIGEGARAAWTAYGYLLARRGSASR